MMDLTPRVMLSTLFLSMICEKVEAQDWCRDILDDGVMRTESIKNSKYGRLVVAARYARMSIQEVQDDLKQNGAIDIEGYVSLSGDSDESRIERFQENVERSLDVDQILQHDVAIARASGDQPIVNAWADCMKKRFGVFAYFLLESDTDREATLVIEYVYKAGGIDDPKIELIEQGDGNWFSHEADGRALKEGATLGNGATLKSFVKRENTETPFKAIISMEEFASVSAYLPRLPNPPQCEPRVVLARHRSYFTDYPIDTPGEITDRGLSVGGGGAHPYNSAYISINSNCETFLSYRTGARSVTHKFPRGIAPSVYIVPYGTDGAVLAPKVDTGSDAIINTCGGSATYTAEIPLSPEEAQLLGSFDIELGDSGSASTEGCPN